MRRRIIRHMRLFVWGITYRVDEYPAEVNVFKGQPAEAAGLKSGDIITAVNGVSIESGEALKEYFDSVGKQLGESVEFSVLRDEEPLEITVVPAMVDVSSLGFSADSFRDKNQGFLSRCYYSIQEVVSWEKYTVATIGQLVTAVWAWKTCPDRLVLWRLYPIQWKNQMPI